MTNRPEYDYIYDKDADVYRIFSRCNSNIIIAITIEREAASHIVVALNEFVERRKKEQQDGNKTSSKNANTSSSSTKDDDSDEASDEDGFTVSRYERLDIVRTGINRLFEYNGDIGEQ